MIGDVEETKEKINISWGLLISLVVISFILGGVVVKVLDNDIQREADKNFCLEEIKGLRNDMKREVEIIERRLNKLENN